MDFIDKNLPDPFYLEKEQRISLRDIIFREAVVNMLVHRNFMGQLPARINIYKKRIEMQNPSLPLKKGLLNVKDCIPHQKNPLISKFFLQLGWVEEIGSGIINISRYYPHFAPKGRFKLIEDDYFQAIFDFEGPVEGPVELSKLQHSILLECRIEPKSKDAILKGLNKEVSGYFKRSLKTLVEDGLLEHTITGKTTSRLQKYRITSTGLRSL